MLPHTSQVTYLVTISFSPANSTSLVRHLNYHRDEKLPNLIHVNNTGNPLTMVNYQLTLN